MSSGTEQERWAPEAGQSTTASANGGAGPPAGRALGQATEEAASSEGQLAEEVAAPASQGELAEEVAAPASQGELAEEVAAPAGSEEAAQPSEERTVAPAPEADLASLLVEVERQRDEYLDALRRLQAEFDNYRKRVERHQREMADNAAGAIVKKLLPALDAADLALAHGGGEDVKQVAAALFDVLVKEGLERIDPAGEAFDPEHHDAIAHEPAEPTDGDEAGGPLVSEVMRAGYRWRGRVLRPAMVKVKG